MPIIGHVNKLVFGWAVGKTASRTLALVAWDRVTDMVHGLGIEPAGLERWLRDVDEDHE